MEGDKEINVLMIDKQGVRVADLLADFLNMSEDGYFYTLTTCDSYHDALSMLEGVGIALIELDLTKEYFMPRDKDFLPWIDEDNAGYRLLAHVKKEYPDSKAIMMVDYPACEDPKQELSEILNKGADGYIVKPYVITKLVEEIQRICRMPQ